MNNAQRPRPMVRLRKDAAAPPPISVQRLQTAPSSKQIVAPRLSPTATPVSPLLPLTRSREQARSETEAAVEDAVAPLSREITALRARLEELEGQRVSAPPVAVRPVATPAPVPPPSAWPPPPNALPAAAAFPRAEFSIEQELRAVDGTRRRRRTVAALSFVLVLVFGSLLGAMAWSYA